MRLTADQRRDAYRHAEEQWPNEACGVIIAGAYYPLPNVHPRPRNAFRIDGRLYAEATATGQLEAIVHSHNDGDASPSAADMRGQDATGVPWAIIGCTGGGAVEDVVFPADLSEPMIGHAFRHGVNDCYTAIRRWYWQRRGVLLPDFARDDQWWKMGGNLYADGFAKAGFRKLGPDEAPGEGDVGMLRMGASRAINHAVVLLTGHRIYHHLPTRVDRTEPFGLWARKVEYWVRFVGLPTHATDTNDDFRDASRPIEG